MYRCDDVNKSCSNCNKAKIDYWDEHNYYATFECPYRTKRTGILIGYLNKHNCEYFESKYPMRDKAESEIEDGNDTTNTGSN
jgi:hypothetical protein